MNSFDLNAPRRRDQTERAALRDFHHATPGDHAPHPEAPGAAGPRRTHALPAFVILAGIAAAACIGTALWLDAHLPDAT
jgi:hypothetical protein